MSMKQWLDVSSTLFLDIAVREPQRHIVVFSVMVAATAIGGVASSSVRRCEMPTVESLPALAANVGGGGRQGRRCVLRLIDAGGNRGVILRLPISSHWAKRRTLRLVELTPTPFAERARVFCVVSTPVIVVVPAGPLRAAADLHA